MAMLNKHLLFITAAIITVLVAISLDYNAMDDVLFAEHFTRGIDTSSPSTFTDYKMNSTEFTKAQQLEFPVPVRSNDVWSNFDRSDSTVFSYSPYTPLNEQGEDDLNDVHHQAELRAIFQKNSCLNGQLKLTDMSYPRAGGPASVTDNQRILNNLVFPPDKRKCNPCDERCEYVIMDTERKLATEEFLVRPRGTDAEEIYARLEQVWTRVFHGIREIVFV